MAKERPWTAPAQYSHARRVYPPLTVSIHLSSEWVCGDLLLWLHHEALGWYGYCHWWRSRTIYTEPVPADRLRPIRRRPVSVYDDQQWRPGTLHGLRRHQDKDWEAAVKLTGWPEPAWIPATRVRSDD